MLLPKAPAVTQPLDVDVEDLNICGCQGAKVYVSPNVAGFVGADAVADVLATGMNEEESLTFSCEI